MKWKKVPSRSLCKRCLYEFWSRVPERKTIVAKLKNRRVYAYSSMDGDSVCFGFKNLNPNDKTVEYHAIRLSREALLVMADLAKQLRK